MIDNPFFLEIAVLLASTLPLIPKLLVEVPISFNPCLRTDFTISFVFLKKDLKQSLGRKAYQINLKTTKSIISQEFNSKKITPSPDSISSLLTGCYLL